MSDRLFDPGPADGVLTDRQQKALYAIKGAGWDGITSEDLGAVMHYPKHPLRETCSFCSSTGYELGVALRQRGLVRQRRRQDGHGLVYMVWTTVDARKQPERDYDLPSGF